MAFLIHLNSILSFAYISRGNLIAYFAALFWLVLMFETNRYYENVWVSFFVFFAYLRKFSAEISVFLKNCDDFEKK